ncbi:MAG: O-antigen ligase family protein [Chloroflexi bacterium]|nr:O-antigen ligase family protein [Chloroflexota bacterium]
MVLNSPIMDSVRLWMPRSMEALWLLAAGLVPVLFATESAMVFVDVPKVAALRSLVAIMAMLWVVEWALQTYSSREHFEGTVWARFRAWTKEEPSRWVMVAATAFFIANVFSMLLSPVLSVSLWGNNPGRDGYGLYNMASYYLLFMVVATHLKTRGQLLRLMGAVTAAATVAAVYSISQYLGFDPFDQGTAQRVQSSFGNPLFAASFMVMALPISLGLGLTLSVRLRSLWISTGWAVLIIVQLAAVLFTLSRGPWIGLAVGLLAWLALTLAVTGSRAISRPFLIKGLVVGAILGGLIFVSLSVLPSRSDGKNVQTLDALFGRALSIGDQVTKAGLEGRFSTWRRSASLLIERPWFELDEWWSAPARHLVGYGPELFLYALPLQWEPESKGLVFATAHNYFIHIGVELGLFGVVSYAAVWVALVIGGGVLFLRRRRSLISEHGFIYAALLASLVVRFVEQMTGVARVSDSTLFWIIAAMVVALPILSRSESTPEIAVMSRAGSGLANNLAWRLGLAMIVVLAGSALIWQKNVNYVRAATLGADGIAEFQQRDLLSGLELMDRAIDLAPDVGFYYITRAEMMEAFVLQNASDETEKVSEQYALLRRALDANPLSHEVRLALAAYALKLAEMGKDEILGAEALKLFNELALMLPGHEEVYNDWAIAYLKLGQPEQALAVLDAYASFVEGRAEPSLDTLYLRSVAYEDMGQIEDALVALREFLTERPWGKYSEDGNRRLIELSSSSEQEDETDESASKRSEEP